MPLDSRREFARMSSIARAPSVPTRLRIWPTISPRAASSPKKSPATAITTSSSGAIDSAV